jgi:hypothetical protein
VDLIPETWIYLTGLVDLFNRTTGSFSPKYTTEKKVPFCYSLMDSAYDSKVIDGFIRSHGRVPIIDVNKRKDHDRPPLDPAKKERYNIRTTVERANSHLKDSLIPRSIYVKGYKKVSFVLMTAVICLAALKYLQLFV